MLVHSDVQQTMKLLIIYGARSYELRQRDVYREGINLFNRTKQQYCRVTKQFYVEKSNRVVFTYTGNAKDRVLVVLLSDRREMLPE
jgi:hypothetical protein